MTASRRGAAAAARARIATAFSLLVMLWAAGGPVGLVAAAEATFDLRIESGRVPEAMRVIRVKEGDRVHLRVTTDRPLTIHLHGYDIERKLAPGAATELVFEAYATGRFPIEVHHPGKPSGGAREESPLAYIEVYPR